MPRLVHKRPAYLHHKQSGRGRVCVAGKYHYLPGAFDSPESREAYWKIIGGIENGQAPSSLPRIVPTPGNRPAVASSLLTVEELVEKYMEHARAYYRGRDGKPTGEADVIRYALAPLLDVCVAVLVSEFKPSDLKTTRQEMIARGWSRRHINHCVRRIKAMFTWGTEEELVPAAVAGAVRMVKALGEGRDPAVKEKPEVEAVSDETLEKIRPFLSPLAADVVQVMCLCGCRPSELKQITVEAIDRTDPACWTCPVKEHKTAYKGRPRVLYFNPTCQAAMAPWMVKAGTGTVFPITHAGLRTVIAKACVKAGVPRFGPNALRHTAGTKARKVGGLEGAQHLLGHKHAKTTEIYAEVDASKARAVALKMG